MYLSKLVLDISAPSVRQSVRDCQDMHRSLMKAFDVPREEAGMLYRVVTTRQQITVLVQSSVQPAWERIDAMGYHCEQIKDISGLPQKYGTGSVLRFSLLACPSKKVKGNGRNSQRVHLISIEDRADWLKRQGEKYGFALLELHEAGDEVKMQGSRSSGALTLSAIPFEGVLQLTDTESFWKAFQAGIGPEKAYGAGLLMLSRV